jgi:hypothetical protein
MYPDICLPWAGLEGGGWGGFLMTEGKSRLAM